MFELLSVAHVTAAGLLFIAVCNIYVFKLKSTSEKGVDRIGLKGLSPTPKQPKGARRPTARR